MVVPTTEQAHNILSEEELRARGFADGEELLLPTPDFDSDSSSDGGCPNAKVVDRSHAEDAPTELFYRPAAMDGLPTDEAHNFLSKEELRARGFADGEELLLPTPDFDSDSSSDGGCPTEQVVDCSHDGAQANDRVEQSCLHQHPVSDDIQCPTNQVVECSLACAEASARVEPSRVPSHPMDEIGGGITSGGYTTKPLPEGLDALTSDPIHSHSERNLASLSHGDYEALWSIKPVSCCNPIMHLDCGKDQQRFQQECVLENRPCIIHGVVQAHQWRAASWSDPNALVEQHGSLPFDLKPGLRMSLERFIEYASSNTADFPFYLSGRGNFKGQEALLNDFSVPNWFADDVYDWVEMGGSFRYFLCGGQRTGTNMHTDPLGTCAWNTSFCGHKRWVLFPPGEEDKYKAMLGAVDEYQKTPPANWFLDVYPGLKNNAEELGMMEYIQRPGETIFVPAGWWHIVLNLDMTIAATMNHMLPLMLPRALQGFGLKPMFVRMLRDELKKLGGDQRQQIDRILNEAATVL